MAAVPGSIDDERRDAAISALAKLLAEDDTGSSSRAIRWLAAGPPAGYPPRGIRKLERERSAWRERHAATLAGFTDEELRHASECLRQGADFALDGLLVLINEHEAKRATERAARAAAV